MTTTTVMTTTTGTTTCTTADCTVTADDLEAVVGPLDADQLDQLAASLHARAVERRRCITDEEARAAFNSVELSKWWQLSQYSDVGRVRGACRVLVGLRRYHPEQIADAMTRIAQQVSPHPLVAIEAVRVGCLDGMAMREGIESDD